MVVVPTPHHAVFGPDFYLRTTADTRLPTKIDDGNGFAEVATPSWVDEAALVLTFVTSLETAADHLLDDPTSPTLLTLKWLPGH